MSEQQICSAAMGAVDEHGLWLFGDVHSEGQWTEYRDAARIKWEEIPQLLTWLTHRWAERNRDKK